MTKFHQYLSTITLATSTFLWCVPASALLAPGDIVVVGLTGDDIDQFTWIPLIDLAAGEEVKFTDNGWSDITNSWSSNEEGSLLFTVPAGGIAAGTAQTVIFESENNNYRNVPEPGNGFTRGVNGIATTGDQLIVWQGSTESPNLIYQVDLDASTFSFNPLRLNNSTALATGLTIGMSAVAVGSGETDGEEFDGAFYQGVALKGTRAEILALISDRANWSGGNSHGDTNYNNGVNVASTSVEIVNTPPKGQPDTAETEYGEVLQISSVLENDTDEDRNDLTITRVSPAKYGQVKLVGGQLQYTPGCLSGVDTFTYTISDGHDGTDTAEVAVTVAPPEVNKAPCLYNLLVSGSPVLNRKLTGVTGYVGDPNPGDTYLAEYQWSSSDSTSCEILVPISGANELTYHVTEADTGHYLCLSMTLTDNHGEANDTATRGTNKKVRRVNFIHRRPPIQTVLP